MAEGGPILPCSPKAKSHKYDDPKSSNWGMKRRGRRRNTGEKTEANNQSSESGNIPLNLTT